jgi:hypothetical protein
MNKRSFYTALIISGLLLVSGWKFSNDDWLVEQRDGYEFHYTTPDTQNK